MAVTMKYEKLIEAIVALFGPDSQQEKKLKLMVDGGAVANFALFHFQIAYGEQHVFQCKLSDLSLHITTKGKLTQGALQLIAQQVNQVIEQAFQKLPSLGKSGAFDSPPEVPASKADDIAAQVVDEVLAKPQEPKPLPAYMKAEPSFKEAKGLAAGIKEMTQAAKPAKKSAYTPSSTSIPPLRDATEIGQKVRGTSGGSIYRTFAIGEVNLAVKMTGSQASIRAEAKGGPKPIPMAQKAKLTSIGFSDHGEYMSIHLQLGDVPALRALGAVIFSLDMTFSGMATSMEMING